MDRKQAFQIIFSFESRIRRYYRRYFIDDADVEDLVQEVICAILSGHGRFKGNSSVSTWIYAICKNQLRKHYHYSSRSRSLVDRLGKSLTAGGDDEDMVSMLELCFDRLRPEQRKLYNDFYRYRKSIREIAVELERPEGTVKYLLHELRKDIAHILGD